MPFSCLKFRKKFKINFSKSTDLVAESASPSPQPAPSTPELTGNRQKKQQPSPINLTPRSNTSSSANLHGVVKEPSTTSAVSRSSSTASSNFKSKKQHSPFSYLCHRRHRNKTRRGGSDQAKAAAQGSYTVCVDPSSSAKTTAKDSKKKKSKTKKEPKKNKNNGVRQIKN
jgi:hypothetical protein